MCKYQSTSIQTSANKQKRATQDSVPPGIVAAITPNSAKNNKPHLTYLGYSFIHSSARCLPKVHYAYMLSFVRNITSHQEHADDNLTCNDTKPRCQRLYNQHEDEPKQENP